MIALQRLKYLLPSYRRREEREIEAELNSLREIAGEDRAELGSLAIAGENARAVWGWAWLESVLSDVRYGLRGLRANRGVTVVAVLSLAAGIGANSAMFSFIDAVFTRPMAVPRISEIVHISTASPQFPFEGVSGADYLDFRHAGSLSGMAAIDYRGPVLTIGDVPESTYAEVVSDNFFTLLGVDAAIGRTFRDEPNPAPAIVLGHRFFQAKFGGDARVIGRALRMRGGMVTVIGVAPPSFRGTRNGMSADLWVPFSTWWGQPEALQDRRVPMFAVIGRLRPGVSLSQAKQEFEALAANFAQAYPATNKGRTARVESDRAHRVRAAGTFSLVLLALVAAVLLVACVNVATLLLARAEARKREMAVRLTLGAGRSRLVRQLFTETALLALLGAAAGFALGALLIRVVPPALGLDRMVSETEFRFDSRVALFSLAVAAASGLFFGLLPALASVRGELTQELKGADPAAGTSRRRATGRNVLIVVQVAVSIVLMVAGILLARSFRRAMDADLGFRPADVLVLEIPNRGENLGQRDLFFQQVVAGVHALPGVRAAAVAMRPPLGGSGGGRTERVVLPGPHPQPADIGMSVVGPGYFSLLGTPLLRGREFDQHDGPAARKVAIVNETGARRLWASEDPIGKLLRTGGPDGPVWEIVGISHDARINSIGELPGPYLYFPFAQMNSGDVNLLVKAGPNPASFVKPVRERLREIDRGLVVYDAYTLGSLVESALAEYRLPSQLAAALALIGVLLAAVGLHGVVSYFVEARTRETGIRMALGARPGDILGAVLRQSARLAACGIALGLLVTLGAGPGLSSRLYGVSPRDFTALSGASILMLFVALAAGLYPARRASRIDPALTLRHD